MKALAIVFIFVAFSFAKLLIIQEGSGAPAFTFPTFDAPTFEPIDLSAGCAGFFDCTEYVGAVFYNIGLGLIFFVEFIIELIGYIFSIIVLLISVQFAGIDGAPFWINGLLLLPFLLGMALIVFKLLRKGDSEA